MPLADVAVAMLDAEIRYYIKTRERVLKVIHGYGSHGMGGEIKKLVHLYLKDLNDLIRRPSGKIEARPGEYFVFRDCK